MSLPSGGPLYRILRFLVRGLLRGLWRLQTEGLAHFPQRGPFIIACNHPSEIDPIVLAAAVPFRPTYLASRHIEQFPVVFWLVRQFDSVFVRRGLTDVGAMRACLSRLARGEVIVVFPEGRVVQDAALGPMHRGAAFLSLRGRVPVVPVALLGTATMWPLGARWPRPARLCVRVGAPLAVPTEDGKRAEEFMEHIGVALRDLVGSAKVNSRPFRESQ
jgi:1-acyl-sn-glycerol-3-phosphate acyltransferase